MKPSLSKKLFILLALLAVPSFSHAANTGNSSGYAWGEGVGYINFSGADSASDYGVTVSNAALTGYAWGEMTGWVSLNCANTSSCATTNYAVANDGNGNLSGYAWSENIGWISFKDSVASNYAVTIDSAGNFAGYAWNETVGFISLNDAGANYGVTTTWRPLSIPTVTTQATTSITMIVAVGNGNVTATGNENPTRFMEWGTTTNTYTSSCSAGTGSTGAYSCNLTSLTPDTTYYVRAKATNSAGTSYGTE
ncbi:MAG: hypothetical protein WC823_00845, partial [Parcubacteria group bacterium]